MSYQAKIQLDSSSVRELCHGENGHNDDNDNDDDDDVTHPGRIIDQK